MGMPDHATLQARYDRLMVEYKANRVMKYDINRHMERLIEDQRARLDLMKRDLDKFTE